MADSKYPEQAPVIECVGWAPVGDSWGIVYVEIQGSEVLHREALSPGPKGESKTAALQRLAVESTTRFEKAVVTRKRKGS